MDRYSQRPVRPAQPAQPAAAPHTTEIERPVPRRNGNDTKKKKLLSGIILGLLLIALAAAAWWVSTQRAGLPAYVEQDKYQAVFLQNGEFYFGKVQYVTDMEIKLTDVYYVQKAAATDENDQQAKTNLELIKLGSEVHGPEDMMVINRSQVLYVENLKSDARVVQLIKEQKAKN